MGKVYVIADIEVTEPGVYEDYKRLSSAAAEKYQGRWLIRGGVVDVLEGDWEPHRLVVVEFEDEEAARRWYNSPEYAEARAVRLRSARSSFLLVRGT
jgi:uncharacterized protein (DUF1330 family)